MSAFWWQSACQRPCQESYERALLRQTQLTKPAGSLGRLESAAVALAAMQKRDEPAVNNSWISIFAGDHGVVSEGVSAYPQAVTVQMLRNFTNGGAAISVLAKHCGATLEVVNLGTVTEVEEMPGVRQRIVGRGTCNFTQEPAMTREQLLACLQIGRDSVRQAGEHGCELFVGGEMGIGNTTAASALACALLGLPVQELVGPGTGLDDTGVQRKIQVIGQALNLHRSQLSDPLTMMRCLGGFELAALTGAYLSCAQQGIPVLVDGFICSVAALVATRLNPDSRQWLLFAHRSAEPGHRHVLQALQAEPLLELELRLGEGSGAGVAIALLQTACRLHNEMATFAEAEVADRT